MQRPLHNAPIGKLKNAHSEVPTPPSNDFSSQTFCTRDVAQISVSSCIKSHSEHFEEKSITFEQHLNVFSETNGKLRDQFLMLGVIKTIAEQINTTGPLWKEKALQCTIKSDAITSKALNG